MQVSGAAPPRPGVKAGRAKAAAAPDPTKQQDRHTTLGGLLLRAELAPDPLERMLAVCRVVLCLSTDLLRPGKGFGDTPTVILGHHYLSRRQLADKHRGDAMQLFLQEICSHEPLPVASPPKYGGGAGGGASSAPASSAPAATVTPAATVQLRARPAAAAKQQQGGLLSQLGGAKAGAGVEGAPAAWLECALEGGATIAFPRHAEAYSCSLPALVLANPTAQAKACQLDFTGTATIACEATGLTAVLRFKPFRGGYVKGSVGTLLGEGHKQIASISGSWQGTVRAESAEGSGVLYEASQVLPPAVPSINLGEPGPRAAARLWTALLEALVYVDAAAAGKEGRKAAELAAAVPAHLRKSLLFEVESSGLKSKQAEAEEAVPAAADPANPAAGVLPPCVQAHHSVHGGLSYQLHYRLQAV